eukprot:8595218-Karenia_brevis.AAC.1
MKIDLVWSNPDFAAPEVAVRTRKREVMPTTINGRVLAPHSGDVQTFCVQYQYGEGRCRANVLVMHEKTGLPSECEDGLH